VRRVLFWAGCAVAVVVAVVVGVVTIPLVLNLSGHVVNSVEVGTAPEPIASAKIGGSQPGSLVSATTIPAFSHSSNGRSVVSARVMYRSTEGDTGQSTVVSGTVFTPTGPAPAGGWPVVSFGHGTIGIDNPCALSLSDSLLGQAPWVVGFAAKGYAVAMTDFQGLGAEGIHPYLDNKTAGYNIIDAVRALRSTFADVSTRWVAFGGSQGGGAAWSADEQAAAYAPELQLLGALAISPAADVVGLVDKAQAGTLTKDQGPAFQLIVESLARLHPDLNRDDYRHGAAAEYWDTLTACSGKLVNDRNAAIAKLKPTSFAPSSPAAADKLRGLLQAWTLPQRPLTAPLFVAYGGKDTFIDHQWTDAALQRACQLGGDVMWAFDPNAGHSEANATVLLTWMDDRFAGKPVGNDCPK
jgi:hypothetical protein